MRYTYTQSNKVCLNSHHNQRINFSLDKTREEIALSVFVIFSYWFRCQGFKPRARLYRWLHDRVHYVTKYRQNTDARPTC
jgi:hypothetical protein